MTKIHLILTLTSDLDTQLDLDMVKMYLYAENEVSSYCSSKVLVWRDRHTETQTDRQTDKPEWNYYQSAYADGNEWIYDVWRLIVSVLLAHGEHMAGVKWENFWPQLFLFGDKCFNKVIPF